MRTPERLVAIASHAKAVCTRHASNGGACS